MKPFVLQPPSVRGDPAAALLALADTMRETVGMVTSFADCALLVEAAGLTGLAAAAALPTGPLLLETADHRLEQFRVVVYGSGSGYLYVQDETGTPFELCRVSLGALAATAGAWTAMPGVYPGDRTITARVSAVGSTLYRVHLQARTVSAP